MKSMVKITNVCCLQDKYARFLNIVVCGACTTRCLYIDVFVRFVESIVKLFVILKLEHRKSLRTGKRSETEKDFEFMAVGIGLL